jgi:hypothetical protein
MGSFAMTKQCVLMQHGLTLIDYCTVGTCCYNRTNPKHYSSYDIDPIGCNACIDQENNNIKSTELSKEDICFLLGSRDIGYRMNIK